MKGTNTIIQIMTPISAVTVGFYPFQAENGRELNSPAVTMAVEIKEKYIGWTCFLQEYPIGINVTKTGAE